MTHDVVTPLRRVPLLGGLTDRELERFARDFTERIIPAGSSIVKEGDERGVGFFVITDGEASVSLRGKEIAKLGPGDHFGEVALISDRVRTASVTASTDVHCFVTSLWEFRSFVKGNADLAWRLLNVSPSCSKTPSYGKPAAPGPVSSCRARRKRHPAGHSARAVARATGRQWRL